MSFLQLPRAFLRAWAIARYGGKAEDSFAERDEEKALYYIKKLEQKYELPRKFVVLKASILTFLGKNIEALEIGKSVRNTIHYDKTLNIDEIKYIEAYLDNMIDFNEKQTGEEHEERFIDDFDINNVRKRIKNMFPERAVFHSWFEEAE